MLNILEMVICIIVLYIVYISIDLLSELICRSKRIDEIIRDDISFETRITTLLTGHDSFIFVACADNKIYVVCAEKKTVLFVLGGEHTGMITCLCLTNDGKILISGSNDGRIVCWSLSKGHSINTLYGHQNMVNSVAISSDDNLIVSSCSDGTIKVWDLPSGECTKTLVGHNYINSIMFSKTGEYVFFCSDDLTITRMILSDGSTESLTIDEWNLSYESSGDILKNCSCYLLSFFMERNSQYIFTEIRHIYEIKKQMAIIEKLTDTHKNIICFDNNCCFIYDKTNKTTSEPIQLMPPSRKSFSFGVANNGEIFRYRRGSSVIIFTDYIFSDGMIIKKLPINTKKT
jgi:WD40 repeat protein